MESYSNCHSNHRCLHHTTGVLIMRRILVLSLAVLPLLLGGCRKKATVSEAPAKPKGPPQVSAAVLEKVRPNEAGAIMVIMYHRILATEKENDLNRRPDSFRKDLETLHAKNYYPVNASDLVNNTMDVPAGKTPVVLTFDDALPTQFKVLDKGGKPTIDPNCAVGIMETFSKKNPDWPQRATFFVLPKEGRNAEPFGQAEFIADKFDYLVGHGYEIANHTSTHASLRGLSTDKIQWELATAFKDIKAINDKAGMQVLALPYGQLPRDDAARKALISGTSSGTSYANKGVFLAAWRPVLSPLTKNDKKWTQEGSLCAFDPYRLERVKPDTRQPNAPGTLEYWLKFFVKTPNLRYISDGDLKVAAIPASYKPMIDETRAKAQGKVLQFYGAGGKGGKGSGGSLSVG
jgi:peptidoglycan/xylan/chitin deacetylase (PgdA/CDA1 family)